MRLFHMFCVVWAKGRLLHLLDHSKGDPATDFMMHSVANYFTHSRDSHNSIKANLKAAQGDLYFLEKALVLSQTYHLHRVWKHLVDCFLSVNYSAVQEGTRRHADVAYLVSVVPWLLLVHSAWRFSQRADKKGLFVYQQRRTWTRRDILAQQEAPH